MCLKTQKFITVGQTFRFAKKHRMTETRKVINGRVGGAITPTLSNNLRFFTEFTLNEIFRSLCSLRMTGSEGFRVTR